ncbi:MAG: transporter [Desulfobacterales bacterium]|nr:transporter [Desulfobacterales bacterium]
MFGNATAGNDHDTKPGDDFHFEWGVGYCQWQLEEDKGTGAPTDKDEAHAIGPEISMFYPPWMTQFTLRTQWEYGVEGRSNGRPEGNRTFLVITKIF